VALGAYGAACLATLLGMFWNGLQTPPNEDRPGTVLMFVVGFLVAVFARAIAKERALRVVFGVALSMAGGIALDAAIHFVIPPETGNLWPLAVLAVGILGGLVALLGSLIADVCTWLLKRAASGTE
jgi:ABC-type branched-subunit amino acid transport system permease subunit